VDEAEEACRGLGKVVGEELLSGLPERLPALRNAVACALGSLGDPPKQSSLAVAALLSAGRAALAEAPARAEAGFRVFKWKVGVEAAGDELSILDDLIGALPQGSLVRLDANGAWDRRTAQRWLGAAADRPIEFVEQPVDRASKGSEDTLLGLARDFPVPIALDESMTSGGDVERWLGLGWPGVYVVKPLLLGDVRGVLAALAAAKARVVFSSALETGIGARFGLGLAFAWTGKPMALGYGVWPLFSDARFDGPVTGPFIRADDVQRIDPEALWNALT
jgi:O-succinylbenzoate synthase